MSNLKKLFISVAGLILLLCLAGCSGEPDPNAGLYICTAVEAEEESLEPESLYGGGFSLTLQNNGRGLLQTGEEKGKIRWSLKGESFTLYTGGSASSGTLKDGVISLELFDSGIRLRLEKEEPEPSPEESADPSSTPTIIFEEEPVSDWWSGDWYGCWRISGAWGRWEELDGMLYDCFGSISPDQEGRALLSLWDEDFTRQSPMAEAELEISGDGDSGLARSLEGYFWSAELQEDQWQFSPGESPFDDMLVLTGQSYEDEEGGFSYELYLRPWGRMWDDVEAAQPELIPYYYYAWYLPLAEAGEPMPDSLEAPDMSLVKK